MGGAIYSIGNLSIENSNFINNTVEKYGGAIYTSGRLYINNSNFQFNSVTNDGSVGGAISLRGTGYINNTIFNKQYTAFAGAGIGNNGNLTINNCSFTN